MFAALIALIVAFTSPAHHAAPHHHHHGPTSGIGSAQSVGLAPALQCWHNRHGRVVCRTLP